MSVSEEVYKSFITVVEMLRDRGVATSRLDSFSYDEIKQLSQTKSIFHIEVNDTCRILYNLNSKFRMADVKKVLDDTFTDVILVTKEKISSTNLKQISELENHTVDTFDLSELLFNISKHSLVPKHEPIRDEAEIQNIIARYRLKSRHQLPLIQRVDPMARYLGLRPGQLVKVTRWSPASGEYTLYRCCI